MLITPHYVIASWTKKFQSIGFNDVSFTWKGLKEDDITGTFTRQTSSPYTNQPLMPNRFSYRNGTDLFGIVSTSWFQPWAPWSPLGPLGAPYGHSKVPYGAQKPKMFSFGPTIKCHTIFLLKISPAIKSAYSYTYTGPLGPHMGPQGAHMGPKNLKCTVFVLQ